MRAALGVVLAICLFLCAASCGNPTATLGAVVAAADAAVASLSATGNIPAADAVIAINYLTGVSTAAAEASAEMSSTDPAPVQAAKIAGYFASVRLAPNTPADITAYVAAVNAAVQAFLAAYPAPAAAPAFAARSVARAKPLSAGQLKKLADIRAKALDLNVKLAALRHRLT